ncbi:hypothetical protein JCM8202_002259 [Rhodotorula sphaerocarpa]
MSLANALSEELPAPAPAPASPAPAMAVATETDKMLAAVIGAVLTSLTMTPFDVIKTRLQTQPPKSQLDAAAFTSLHNSPWPPPVPSTSKANAEPIDCCKVAPEKPAPGRPGPARYFNPSTPSAASSSSSSADLLCRFDPRIARASLPAAGAHGAAVSSARAGAAGGVAAAAAAGGHQYLHHLAPVPLASSASNIACLYPASTGHATLSLPYHLSHATSFAVPAPPAIAPNHAQHRYLTGFTDALAHIVRSEGATALWRGTAPALAMSVPGQVVYMVGYDSLRKAAFDRAPTWALRDTERGAWAETAAPATTATDASGRPPLKASYVTAVPLLAGALSRTVVAVLLSPLELVRTQLQSHVPTAAAAAGSTAPNSRAGLASLLRDLRWSTAWRGLPPTLWRDVPFSGIYWAGYEAIKRSLTGGRGMGETSVGEAARSHVRPSKANDFMIAFVSGAGSGMVAATLTNPFDVIKTRRQAAADAGATAANANRTFTLLRTIVRQEGYRGLFAGLTPRLAKVGPACGLMIGCYEAISSLSAASREPKTLSHRASNAE